MLQDVQDAISQAVNVQMDTVTTVLTDKLDK